MNAERLKQPEVRKLLEKSYGEDVRQILVVACEELKIDLKDASMTVDEYAKLSNYLSDEQTRTRLYKG